MTINPTDPGDLPLTPAGLQLFATGNQAFFLAAAGDMIRHACGWHIAPSTTVTERLPIGGDGSVVLPSLHVTGVSSVTVDGTPLDPARWVLDGCSVSLIRVDRWQWWSRDDATATITYTHGYDELPRDVAAIGYELVQQARSRPGGNARELGAGPYRVVLLKLGVGLDDDQLSRLRQAGVVRPGVA